jgi:hypothetical protein
MRLCRDPIFALFKFGRPGRAIGYSWPTDGDIDARTAQSVSRIFAAYHDKLAKVAGGLTCPSGPPTNLL